MAVLFPILPAWQIIVTINMAKRETRGMSLEGIQDISEKKKIVKQILATAMYRILNRC